MFQHMGIEDRNTPEWIAKWTGHKENAYIRIKTLAGIDECKEVGFEVQSEKVKLFPEPTSSTWHMAGPTNLFMNELARLVHTKQKPLLLTMFTNVCTKERK